MHASVPDPEGSQYPTTSPEVEVRRLREIKHLDCSVRAAGDNGPVIVGVNVEVDALVGRHLPGKGAIKCA